MTVAGHRHERIAEEIHHEISTMLAGELKDPRIAELVTVTEVRVSPDLKQARIYVSVLGSEEEQTSTLEPMHIWVAILTGHIARCGLSVARFNQGKWRAIAVEIEAG